MTTHHVFHISGNWNRMHTYPYQMQQQLYSRNYDISNDSLFPPHLTKHPIITNTPTAHLNKYQSESSSPSRSSQNIHGKSNNFSDNVNDKDSNMVSCQYKEPINAAKEAAYLKQPVSTPTGVFISRNVSMNYSITEHKLNYPHKHMQSGNVHYLHSN